MSDEQNSLYSIHCEKGEVASILTAWPWVMNLEVLKPYRGRGLASALLWVVCREADRRKIQLLLNPVPFAGGRLGPLLRLYGRFGFRQAANVAVPGKPPEVTLWRPARKKGTR